MDIGLIFFLGSILGLVYLYQWVIRKETGVDELSWNMTLISILAAFGTPSAMLGILSFLIKAATWILL